ncbi:MAG TPA: hypothetical protein VKE92_07725 [Anaerolineales bacterium]|nr:hypothetical protein [Anaerolineales bacterium]
MASSTYKLTPKLGLFFLKRNILLNQPIKPFLLNASRMDLWLALDTEGEATSRRTIGESGPAPIVLLQSDDAGSFCVE